MEEKEEFVTMAHGAGGALMAELVEEEILKALPPSPEEMEVPLSALEDSSVMDGIVLTTDSYVVKPIIFPGGDIGRLAVSGTVNDLSVMGCRPLALTLGLILEEGLPVKTLRQVLSSVATASREAGVPIITGDTKVVESGALDGMVINTSGIGRHWDVLEGNLEVVREHRSMEGRWLRDSALEVGDSVILSGPVGDHGVALLSFREGYGFESEVRSDVAPLSHMIERALDVGGIVAIKDPTRGGLANALNEWAAKSGHGILVRERDIPLRNEVVSACEMLGIDPLQIGNEGKAIFGVVAERAGEVLEALRGTDEGNEARIIGQVTDDVEGVVMRTLVGGKRIIDTPSGDPIPRIC